MQPGWRLMSGINSSRHFSVNSGSLSGGTNHRLRTMIIAAIPLRTIARIDGETKLGGGGDEPIGMKVVRRRAFPALERASGRSPGQTDQVRPCHGGIGSTDGIGTKTELAAY